MKRVTFSLIAAIGFAGSMTGCGGSDTPPDVTTVSMANPAKYVANALLVPMTRSDYSIDLNGDGKLDNQLGNIIGALSAQNLNTQDGVDKSIASGGVVLLLTQTSADPSYMADDASGVTVNVGNTITAPAMPDFSGQGTFTVNGGVGAANFAGRISNGTYSSNSPVTTTHPVNATLQLPLVAGADPVTLSIIGAHITFRVAAGKIMNGQLHGAIKNSDVQGKIVPGVAKLLDGRVVADPTTSTNKQILMIFDNGGEADTTGACNGVCANPAGDPTGACAKKGDGRVSICEVATNSIIKNVLNPDVQMFDAAGNYHPNAANDMKDSLSLGVGFTAVKASF